MSDKRKRKAYWKTLYRRGIYPHHKSCDNVHRKDPRQLLLASVPGQMSEEELYADPTDKFSGYLYDRTGLLVIIGRSYPPDESDE